jgi:hypothetical protein
MPAPQQTPPQQPSGPTYEDAAAALAGGTVASGVAAGAPGAAGAATGVLSAEAAAKTSQTILSKILGFAKLRWNVLFDPSGPVVKAVKQEYPNRPLEDVMKLVDDREREFEREFRRKMRKRLEADVPEALSHPDPDVRARKLANIFRREMRYTAMREEAILSRAMGALEADMLQTLSPKGAYWKLSPHVKEHTLDCLAMGEKFWPWSVLRKVQPPLHYGCPCALLGLDEVIEMGLMTANQVPDEADARARYGRIADKIDGMRDLDEAIIEELYAAAYENLDVEEAAVRKPLRWARGLIKGGQFRPTRGGSVGARTTRGIPLPESPTKQRGAARGRWTWVGGTYTKVPEADSWTKTVGERTYHSPAGGTNLYANGQLINEPGQTGNPAERVKASAGTIARPIPPELAAKVDSARSMFRDAAHPGRGVPPVAVGDGPSAVMNLRDAGYVPVDSFLAGSSRRQVWRSPEGKADIEIGAKGVITRVVWEPAPATRDRVALSRPAYSWEEHASDALAYADELGDKYKADVKAPTFEADLAMEDHAGTHLWTGEIKVGGETPVDVERAGIARREGNPLSEDEKRGVYASYWVTGHELSHAINPITPYLFSDPVEASLEEALAEEMGHKLALDRLASHGQYDVIDWRFKNPNALAVRGVYPNERFALQTILDEAGVPQRDRASVMEKMCFRMSPDSRLSFLATLHAGNTGGDTMASRNRIASLLGDPKRAPQDFRSIINPDSLRQGIPAQYGLWDHEPKGTPGNWFANEDGLNQATAMIQNSPTGASTVGDGVPVVKYGDGSVGVGTPHGSSSDSLTYAPNAAAAAEIALMRSDYAAVYANDYKASKRRVSDDKPTIESPAQKASKRALAARKANPESPGTVPDPSFEYAVKVKRKMDKKNSLNDFYEYGHVNAKDAKSIGALIEKARVSVRVTPAGLSSFLKTGVMLTSMDRGQRPSWRVKDSGYSAQDDHYLKLRRVMEEALFGPSSPVYGYFRHESGTKQDVETEFYGGVIVELNPQVKDRTTWSIGDSLNTSEAYATVAKGKDEGMYVPGRGGIVPSPVGESSPLAVAILGPWIPEDFSTLVSIDDLFSERDPHPLVPDKVVSSGQGDPMPDYTEAQIHGSRPTTDEVARVIFQIPSGARGNVEKEFGPNASQAKALDKAGIPWELQRWGGKVVKRGKTDYVAPDQTAWERTNETSWGGTQPPAVVPQVGGKVEKDQIEGAPIGSRIGFVGEDGKPLEVERRHYGWFLAENPDDFTFSTATKGVEYAGAGTYYGGSPPPNALMTPAEIESAVNGVSAKVGKRFVETERYGNPVLDTELVYADVSKGATWSALPPVSYSPDSLPDPPQSPGWGWFSKDEQKVEKSAWAGKGKRNKPQPPPKPKVIGGKMGVSEYNGTPFPDYDGTRLTFDKPAGGSNGAMWANDDAGNKWLVKTYRGDEDRIATELVANRVYDLMGAKVAKAGTIEVDGKKGLTYQALDGKPRNGVFKQNGPNAQMGEHYMTDALLANWDFAGLTDDNVLWDDAGNPIRVDQGGTLEFRAMGQQKPFGPIPTDVWTMIRKGQAKRASLVSEDQMRAQAGDIAARLTPQEIDGLMDTAPFQDDAMRERVRENLKARVEWMGAFSRGEIDLPQIPQGQAARDEFAATQDFEAYPEELVALEFYSRGGFLPVQKHLRSKAPKEAGSTDVNNAIASLDALLRDAKTKEDLIVYVPLTDPLPDALRGKTVEERSYIHASTDASDESMIRLLVPAGSHVLSLRELDGTPAEAPEIVIRRKSRIKITDLRDDGTADATLLPPAPKPYKPSFAGSKAQKPSSKGNGQMKFPEPPQSPGTVADIERARVELGMVQRRIAATKRPSEDDLRVEKEAEDDLRTAILNDANARGQETPPASQGTNANLVADAKKLETLSVGRSVRLSNGKSYTYDQSPTADDPFYVLTAKDDGSSRSIYAGITNTLPTEREWRQESERGTLLRPSQELRTKRLLTPSPASPGTSDVIPPEPGTAPIPYGALRFWHYTYLDNLPSIRENGLSRDFARGDDASGDEQASKGVWASSQAPSADRINQKAYVEFWVMPDELTTNAEHFRDQDPQEWIEGQERHVIMQGSVPPEQIVAIHEPWHGTLRYLDENYPDGDPDGKFAMWPDDAQEGDSDYDPEVTPAVRAWRRKNGFPPVLAHTEPPASPGTGTSDNKPYGTGWEMFDPRGAEGILDDLIAPKPKEPKSKSALDWQTSDSAVPAPRSPGTAPTLTETLTQFASLMGQSKDKPEGWKYGSLEELILTEGRSWEPQSLPESAAAWKGEPKQCYKNAADAVLGMGGKQPLSDARYVEGFVHAAGLEGLPIAHAWVVDKDDKVLELTLNEPGVEYQGIEVPNDVLARTLLRRESYGVFDDWQAGFPFLQHGMTPPPQSPGTTEAPAVSPLANVSVTHEEGASHLSIKGWPDDGSVPTYGTQTNTTNDGLNSETLFAVENDEYIGYLEYAVGQGKDRDPFGNLSPEQREAVVVYVEELSVAPSQQRRGVATTLMATLHERYPNTPINHGNRTNDGRAWADATLGGAEVTMDGEPLPPQSPGTKPKGKYASLVPDSMREAANTAGVTIENPGRNSRLLWALGKDKQPTGKAAEWTPALANAAMQDQKFYEDAGAAIAAMGEQYPEVMGFLTSLSWVSNPSLIPGYSKEVREAMTNFGAAFIRYGDDEAKIAFNDTKDKSPGAMLLITGLSPASQTGYGEFLHEFGHVYAEVHGDMNDRLGLVGKYDFAAEEDFDWMDWTNGGGESLGWDLLAEHFNLMDVMDVSDYGSTNANEAFAEMFAMHHHPDFDLTPELDAQFEKFLAAMKARDLSGSTLPAPPASPGTSDGRLAALAMSEADARATLTGHGIKVGERDPAKSTDEDEQSWLGAMAYLTDLFPEAVNYLGEVTYASSPTLADSPIEGGTRAGTLAGGLRRSAQAGNWAAIITRNEKWQNPNLSGLGNHRGKIIFNDLRKGSDWAYLDNFDEGQIIKIGGKSELAGRWKRLADGWERRSDPSVTATSEELHRVENEGFTVMSGPLNSVDATAARAVHEFGHALAESWYGGSALSEQLPETIKGQAIREAIRDKNPEVFEAMPYGLFWAWTDKIKRYTGGDIGWRVFTDAGISIRDIGAVSKYASTEPSEAFSELLAAHYLGLLPEDVDAKFAALLDTMRGAQ